MHVYNEALRLSREHNQNTHGYLCVDLSNLQSQKFALRTGILDQGNFWCIIKFANFLKTIIQSNRSLSKSESMVLDSLSEHEPYLRLLLVATNPVRRAILKHAPPTLIVLLCSCSLNILKQNLDLKPEELDQLKSHRRIVYLIANPSQSLDNKRTALQSTDAIEILPTVVGVVLRAFDGGLLK